jgi:transcriptional regulator with XRE-family HTH domain
MSRSSVKLYAVSEQPSLLNAPPVAPPVGASDTAADMPPSRRRSLQQLGERVTDLRRQKGWNRTTLARKAAVTVTTLRGCEEGSKVTQPDKLRAIAKALGVSVSRFEADERDPRVKHWTDEDYEIGNWYHNAPRQLKNRVWALHDVGEAGHALMDPQFAGLLEGWANLTAEQKQFVLNALAFVLKPRSSNDGGLDALSAATLDPKTRGPQR